MKAKWDLKELYDFADRLEQFSEFEKYMKEATRDLAKVLQQMLFKYTPVVTGTLRIGWGGENSAFVAKRVANGFEVTLVNNASNGDGYMYGTAVNDGHYSHNQFNIGGAPYVVKHRTPKVYTIEGANTSDTYVFGHFFVEKSVIETESKAEEVIYEELKKWFRWCCGG